MESYLADINTRSFTEYEVTDTAKIKDIAAITVICLNWVSPSKLPKMLTVSTAPTT